MWCFCWLYQGVHFLIKRSHCPEAKPNGSSGPGSKRSKMNFLKGSSLREGSMGLGLWRSGQSSQAHFPMKLYPQTREGRHHLPSAWQRCSQHSTPPTVLPQGPPLLSPFLPEISLPIHTKLGTHNLFPPHSPSCLHGTHSLCSSKIQAVGLKVTHMWCIPGLVLHLQDTWQWLETLLGTLLTSRGWRPGVMLNIL